jgi:hypothetical protein
VRHTSRFPRIFGRISIQLKNRFDPGNEFFNRNSHLLPFADITFAEPLILRS